MNSIDSTVKKETLYIAVWVIIFSVIMQSVFLISGNWNYTVLLGNLLGGVLSIGNFLLMGITVQNAVKKEEKEAKNTMKISQSLRFLLLLIGAVIGVARDCFNALTVLISLFVPRLAIALRPLFEKNKEAKDE